MAEHQEGDVQIQCIGCPNKFWFTVRDQEFYRANGYQDPKRCRNCRAKKKAQQESDRHNDY